MHLLEIVLFASCFYFLAELLIAFSAGRASNLKIDEIPWWVALVFECLAFGLIVLTVISELKLLVNLWGKILIK